MVAVCFGWSSPSMTILHSPSSPITITNDEGSWIISLMQFGSALGPVLGAILCKNFGPKMCILISTIPYFVGFLLIIVAQSPEVLYISRILSGLAVGMSFISTPLYLAEISENHNRGGLIFLFTVNLSLGAIFIAAIAPYVSLATMAGIMLIFPLLLLTLWFAPESPLYYIRVKKGNQALQALRMLRRQNDTKVLEAELDSMKTNTIENIKFIDCLKECVKGSNIKAFMIVFLTTISHQLCGALPVLLNLESVYSSTNMDLASNIGILLTATLGFVMSVISIRLPDILGRKPLLLMSAIGCIASNAMLGVFYLVSESNANIPNITILALVAINLLLTSAVLGLQPMPYILAGEMFSANVKEICICAINVGGAFLGFGTSKIFQIVEDAFGKSTVFFGLMVISIILGIIMFIVVPETKGKSFHEIQMLLKGSESQSKFNRTSEANANINEGYSHTYD